jgi:GST-like protein
MIDLFYAPGPNPRKISIMLEECGLPYNPIRLDLNAGDQHSDEYRRINPNGRIPAIIDHDHPGGPHTVFESGAILLYLAEKTGRFLGEGTVRSQVLQWLFWQMGGLGPMGGQLSHFINFAPSTADYARSRYVREYDRLLGVLDLQLATRDYIVDDYSIADMACFPWLLPYKVFHVDLDKFTHVRRWFDRIKARPAVQRAVALGMDWEMERIGKTMSDAEFKTVFGADRRA